MIFKNAVLSIKKSIGKSVLLFILMALIANLVIAGLSIKSATTKSMEQVRESLGSEVTLSYNMKNMMANRDKGEAMDEIANSITVDMANQLKALDYVKSYNYTQTISVNSDDIDPVATTSTDSTTSDTMNKGGMMMQPSKTMDSNDFTINGNTSMENLKSFTNENYVLTAGRLLTTEDSGTKNCVIETNLASDNDLEVGETFTVTATDEDDNETSVKLTIVGIYEIETTDTVMGMSNRQSPYNSIYTDLSVAQTLNQDTSAISSATYYLDDPDHIEEFKELAQKTDIDFETYTLDADDRVYQASISSLENMESFATIFLWVVVIAGSAILCLILILTLRSRFYEFGVLLSLGQAKIKIIMQQLLEVGLIAAIAFCLSLGTGKMVSNVVSGMLESSQSSNSMVMNMDNQDSDSDSNVRGNKDMFSQAMASPTNADLDVSVTSTTIVQLAEITAVICIVSVLIPSMYILRLSPREILIKKEG